MKTILQTLWQTPRNCAIAAITLYQYTLSPDHGPLKHLYPYGYCRHKPTCSEFSKQAFKKGCIYGAHKTIVRIASCHPFSRVPDEKILHTLHQE